MMVERQAGFNENYHQIRPKCPVKSLMVSVFLCERHGLLRLSDEQKLQYPEYSQEESDATKTIRPGSKGEGYWTNAVLVEQTKKAMAIFKILHPTCDASFVFDKSANHHAFPQDALVASRLNLRDGGKNIKEIMRDGWFTNENGERVAQSFHNHKGEQKGLKTISRRLLWHDNKI
jgi:hypothetical protein